MYFRQKVRNIKDLVWSISVNKPDLFLVLVYAETSPEPCQTSKAEFFAKIVCGF